MAFMHMTRSRRCIAGVYYASSYNNNNIILSVDMCAHTRAPREACAIAHIFRSTLFCAIKLLYSTRSYITLSARSVRIRLVDRTPHIKIHIHVYVYVPFVRRCACRRWQPVYTNVQQIIRARNAIVECKFAGCCVCVSLAGDPQAAHYELCIYIYVLHVVYTWG